MKTHELVLMLPVGSANAISMRDLAEKLGITERTLRDRVRYARLDGYEIIGDMHGYYLLRHRKTAGVSTTCFTSGRYAAWPAFPLPMQRSRKRMKTFPARCAYQISYRSNHTERG